MVTAPTVPQAREWLERHIRACGGSPADWDIGSAARCLVAAAEQEEVPFSRLPADTLGMILGDALMRNTPGNRRICRTILLPDEAWRYALRLEKGDM